MWDFELRSVKSAAMAEFWSGKRVLIPGGAGFIGSHLVELLASMGADVTVLDDLSSGRWSRLDGLAGRIRRIESDVTDPATRADCFPGMDVVMNLTGLAPGLTLDEGRHERLYQENTRVATAVLDGVLAHRVPRLLVVSSSCVYPDDAPVPTPEISLEGSEPEAVNRGYGLAKRAIEAEAMLAARTHPWLSIAIARPFNVYGARDCRNGPGAHVIPSLLEKILSPDPEVVVWGSGKQTRSFIHGHGIARGLALVTELHAVADPVNIGSASEIRLCDLIETLMELSEVRKSVHFDTGKPEGAARKAADISKLQQIATGFRPAASWQSGLRELVDACHTNERVQDRC